MVTSGAISGLTNVPSGSVAARPDVGAKPRAKIDQTPVATQEQENRRAANTLSKQDIQGLADDLNEHIKLFNTKVSFTVDEATGQTVIHIRDTETDEIVREVPAEEMLKLANKLSEIIGIIVDRKV